MLPGTNTKFAGGLFGRVVEINVCMIFVMQVSRAFGCHGGVSQLAIWVKVALFAQQVVTSGNSVFFLRALELILILTNPSAEQQLWRSKVAEERSEEETVAYSIENGIAWVKFNRPEKRNCMSPKLNRQMFRVLETLEYDDSVGVLVLTGEGSSWTAGMDLKEYFREVEDQGLSAVRQSQHEAYSWWRRLRWYQKPTIAMVKGWFFGGGYAPLHSCDLAFAAEDAQFGLSEINWGILPGGGATKVATNLMSFRKSMYHALMGENIDGKTAAEWGLVNETVPASMSATGQVPVCG